MQPILFELGPITIHTVSLFHTGGILIGIWWLYRQAIKNRLDPQKIMDLSLVVVLWAVIGARLFSILFDGSLQWYLQNPAKMLMLWNGGFTFYGGFLFGLGAGIWYVRKHKMDVWKVSDMAAPGLALGIAFGRLGCFFSGDSYGKPTDLPWAVTFSDPLSMAPTGVSLHPTQIYSTLVLLVVFGILLWWQKQQRFKGELFLAFIMLYSVVRSFVEIFRNDPRGVYLDGLISTSQIISLLVVIPALWLYFKKLRQYKSLKLDTSQ
jgi:phosphatidylglycerol:prolipoprotein diacylglycerol transferase